MANVAHLPKIVGFGFRPTDEELVDHYLTKKLLGEDPVLQIIPEIELCKHDPWEIPGLRELSIIKSDDPQWFFFSPPDYKYSNRKQSNRSTNFGFWKPTGIDRNIKARGSNEIIGTKKTLVFYEGRARRGAVRTNWVIHEYHAFPEDQRTFVLCKLMYKHEEADGRTGDEGEPRAFMPPDYVIVPSEGRIPEESNDYVIVPSEGRIPEALVYHESNLDEYQISLLLSSPNVNEQELPFPFPPGFNSHTGNDDSIVNVPPEFTEEEVNFSNSLLVDDY